MIGFRVRNIYELKQKMTEINGSGRYAAVGIAMTTIVEGGLPILIHR